MTEQSNNILNHLIVYRHKRLFANIKASKVTRLRSFESKRNIKDFVIDNDDYFSDLNTLLQQGYLTKISEVEDIYQIFVLTDAGYEYSKTLN